jgi:uncharacterized SAM-binding protein YcdF (DUF218 family)
MFCGIITRRERLGLSWRGWLVLVLIVSVAAFYFMQTIQPFLAKTQRVETNVLVVEGWIHEYATRAAAAEFQSGHYNKIFTTGGPIVGTDGSINDFNTSASVGAGLLEKDGVAKKFIQAVPSHVAARDRTYGSAIALRDWFRAHNVPVHSMNVLTESAHARRTQMLFQKAFGQNVAVGVISIPDPDYDPRHWWRDSEGVRDVLDESIAYIYAKIFFHPANVEIPSI